MKAQNYASFSLESPATNSMIKSYSSNEGSSKSTVQPVILNEQDSQNEAFSEEEPTDFTALSPSFCSSLV